jgi:hypothetical protein
MSLTQFLVMAAAAVLVTIPVVLLIPRARASTTFDRLLWTATPLVGFLVAWVAVAMAKSAGSLDALLIGDTPILPVLIGTLAGELAVNLPLGLLDRFDPGEGEPVPDELEEFLPAETSEREEAEEAAAAEK